MNSEEIKEIGQMFLNISNQNHSMNLGLTDEDVIKGVISKIKEDLAYPDWQALEKSEEMLSKQTDLLGERVLTLEKEALKIRKFQDDTHNKIRILYDGSWKKSDVDKQLNKLRKDYRDLQDEMWNRFKLIEDWIKSETRREKDTLKAEIAENGKAEMTSSAHMPQGNNIQPKRYHQNQAAREKWDTKDLQKLELSVRSHNSLRVGGITHIGDLITYSPRDLLRIKNFGRKCLNEVINALADKELTLNLEKERQQRLARRERIVEQFKL